VKRTALVTGANRGLGREVCRRLADEELEVILTSRDARDGEEAADTLGVLHRPLDVVEPASVEALVRALKSERRHVDVLVNNAGVALDGFDAEVARRTLEVNFFGAVRVTEALLPLVRSGGSIVMVSSGLGQLDGFGAERRGQLADAALDHAALLALVQGFEADVAAGRVAEGGWPLSAYRVSKAALNAYVRILAPTLRERRIAVNAVCPGWVRTEMGGPGAPRSIEEGARSIAWAALLSGGEPTGGFFRDGRPIPW
jgi:carbonyl reductase 1